MTLYELRGYLALNKMLGLFEDIEVLDFIKMLYLPLYCLFLGALLLLCFVL
jgi:hypothetical protein